MIGIVVPAHNEEAHIGACLQSLLAAARWPALQGEDVLIVVALDTCSDATERSARRLGVATVAVEARNVGAARAAGAALALRAGARWLGFTDADSTVAPDWVHAQLAQGCDAVCGTVTVADWSSYANHTRTLYDTHYTDADGHRHIHGANLGVSGSAYRAVGGFPALASSEDVALVRALQAHGASIAWSSAPRVVTSARRRFKAPDGFGATLARFDRLAARSGGATAPCGGAPAFATARAGSVA